MEYLTNDSPRADIQPKSVESANYLGTFGFTGNYAIVTTPGGIVPFNQVIAVPRVAVVGDLSTPGIWRAPAGLNTKAIIEAEVSLCINTTTSQSINVLLGATSNSIALPPTNAVTVTIPLDGYEVVTIKSQWAYIPGMLISASAIALTADGDSVVVGGTLDAPASYLSISQLA